MFPRLRPVDPQWVRVDGEDLLWLRDPLELAGSGRAVLIPAPLVPLIAACDGTQGRQRPGTGAAPQAPGGTSPRGRCARSCRRSTRRCCWKESACSRPWPGPWRTTGPSRSGPRHSPGPATRPIRRPWPPASGASARAGRRKRRRVTWAPPRTSWPAGSPRRPAAPLQPIDRAAGLLSPHIDYTRGGTRLRRDLGAGPGGPAVGRGGGRLRHRSRRQRRAPDAHPAALRDALGPAPLRRAGRRRPQRRARGRGGVRGGAAPPPGALHRAGGRLAALGPAPGRAPGDVDLPPLVPVLCGSFHPYVAGGLPPPGGRSGPGRGRSTPWRGPSAGARPWSSPRPTWPTSAPPSAIPLRLTARPARGWLAATTPSSPRP